MPQINRKLHLIPHKELRGVVARANDVEIWCYLSAIRGIIWRYMAQVEIGGEHGAWMELRLEHMERSESIVDAEIASRRLLQSLPRG